MNKELLSQSPASSRYVRPSAPSLAIAAVTLTSLSFGAEASVPHRIHRSDDAATCILHVADNHLAEVQSSPGSVAVEGARREHAYESDLLHRVVSVLCASTEVNTQSPNLKFAAYGDLRGMTPDALRALRVRLLDEVDDIGVWAAAVRAAYPEADSIEVPERFIAVATDAPVTDTLSEDLERVGFLKWAFEEG